MHIAFDREKFALTQSRESAAPSLIGGKAEARPPFGLTGSDDHRASRPTGRVTFRLDPARVNDAPTGPATVGALLRARMEGERLDPARVNDVPTGPAPGVALLRARIGGERLDPARVNDDGDWWQRAPTEETEGAAGGFGPMSGQTGEEPVGGLPEARQQTADISALVTAAAASDRPSAPTFSSETARQLHHGQSNDALSVAGRGGPAPAEATDPLSPGKRGPAFLFAGEMSYAAGVDILADALVTVCQRHRDAQFILVGDGPLKSDVEAQVSAAGFAHRCRLTGELPAAEMEELLATCDVVVIPARERQDGGLAERALSLGKPVLTTHQAQVGGIVHGHNGLVAYDCANSLVWGLHELLTKPLPACRRRQPDERQAA